MPLSLWSPRASFFSATLPLLHDPALGHLVTDTSQPDFIPGRPGASSPLAHLFKGFYRYSYMIICLYHFQDQLHDYKKDLLACVLDLG